jgi:hypothetical protein
MPTATAPIWKDTHRTFADEMGWHEATAKRKTKSGEIRSVKIGKKFRRLEPVAEYVAREGVFSGPAPKPAADASAGK